jgi:hypothetical protein
MIAHLHSKRYDGLISIPTDWDHFWLSLSLSLIFLFISALLAKVRIGSFPANPIYWHIWVIQNAELPPLINERQPFRLYRFYMFFWAGSLCCLIFSLAILMAMTLS